MWPLTASPLENFIPIFLFSLIPFPACHALERPNPVVCAAAHSRVPHSGSRSQSQYYCMYHTRSLIMCDNSSCPINTWGRGMNFGIFYNAIFFFHKRNTVIFSIQTRVRWMWTCIFLEPTQVLGHDSSYVPLTIAFQSTFASRPLLAAPFDTQMISSKDSVMTVLSSGVIQGKHILTQAFEINLRVRPRQQVTSSAAVLRSVCWQAACIWFKVIACKLLKVDC